MVRSDSPPVLDRWRGAMGKLHIIAYRPETRWPKHFRRALATDMHSALRCNLADTVHLFGMAGRLERSAPRTQAVMRL
jgi:hypothetical protein